MNMYLVVREGAVLGNTWYKRGDSEHVIDEGLHQLEETVSCSKVQSRSEHHVRNLEI